MADEQLAAPAAKKSRKGITWLKIGLYLNMYLRQSKGI